MVSGESRLPIARIAPSAPGFGGFRLRYLLGLGLLVGGASLAQPVESTGHAGPAISGQAADGDLSVMTYNVKGLPWPLDAGRGEALQRIGARLARLRAQSQQPTVVLLQEAFTPGALAIGNLAAYPYQVHGPYVREQPGDPAAAGGKWYRGETQQALLDSGLVILSDFPIVSVERAAFPSGACAGYDCLAAKGIIMVRVDVPGKGAVTIATTHMNSRKASGAPVDRTHAAYRKQAEFLAEFVRRNRPADAPLVLAGDFNRGQRPMRIAALQETLGRLAGAAGLREALRERMAEDVAGFGRSDEARWIRGRARDMQFVFDGAKARLDPIGAAIPFGVEGDGSMLSDHMGYTIRYRLVPLRAGSPA